MKIQKIIFLLILSFCAKNYSIIKDTEDRIVAAVLSELSKKKNMVLFAYSKFNQKLMIPNAFQNISFNHVAENNGWKLAKSTTFSPTKNGSFLILYSAQLSLNSKVNTNNIINFRVLNNGTEIPGSKSELSVVNNKVLLVTKNFVVDLKENDKIIFQYSSNNIYSGLVANKSHKSLLPSISITITEI